MAFVVTLAPPSTNRQTLTEPIVLQFTSNDGGSCPLSRLLPFGYGIDNHKEASEEMSFFENTGLSTERPSRVSYLQPLPGAIGLDPSNSIAEAASAGTIQGQQQKSDPTTVLDYQPLVHRRDRSLNNTTTTTTTTATFSVLPASSKTQPTTDDKMKVPLELQFPQPAAD